MRKREIKKLPFVVSFDEFNKITVEQIKKNFEKYDLMVAGKLTKKQLELVKKKIDKALQELQAVASLCNQ